MPTKSDEKTVNAQPKGQRYWIMYVSLLLSGLILLGDAYDISHLARWTARVGLALVYSAVALIAGQGRASGIIATIIIWLSVLLTILL